MESGKRGGGIVCGLYRYRSMYSSKYSVVTGLRILSQTAENITNEMREKLEPILCHLCGSHEIKPKTKLLLTGCRVVAVWKRFVGSFSHKHPLIVFEFAFNDFVVEFLQLLGYFDRGKGLIESTNIQISNFFRQNTVNSILERKHIVLMSISVCKMELSLIKHTRFHFLCRFSA